MMLLAGAALLIGGLAGSDAGPAVAGPVPWADVDRPAEVVRADELVTALRGTLPIIISAPHGGMVRVQGSRDREADGAVLVRDVNTAELAQLVGVRLTHKLGGKPYIVVAHFSRRDADANRPPDDAFENDAARLHYEAYHRALRAFVDEVREQHGGRGILIDLHGQVRIREAMIRGTRTGRTVQRLLEEHGAEAVTGPESVFGALAAKGYLVVPALPGEASGTDAPGAGESPTAEEGGVEADAAAEDDSGSVSPHDARDPFGIGRETIFNGGYIVAAYGSHHENGIDAIQIEMGADRINGPWTTARDVADAIAVFAARYVIDGGKPAPAETAPAAAP